MPARPASVPRLGAPRFDLRLRRRACRASLSEPLIAGAVRVHRLELEAPVSGPFDMSSGASRFRHRHAIVTKAEVGLSLPALEAHVEKLGLRLGLDAIDLRQATLTLSDDVGALALDLRFAMHGPDLYVEVLDFRWFHESPQSPWERLAAIAHSVGLSFDVHTSRFRYPRLVRQLLAEALMPHGWRVPDERALGWDCRFDQGVLVFEPTKSPRRIPESGTIAAALEAALDRGEMLDTGALPDWVAAVVDGRSPGPTGRLAGLVEEIVDDGEQDIATLRKAVANLDTETSAMLRAEALLGAAGAAFELEESELACEWVLDGLTLIPRDSMQWIEWCQRLAAAGLVEALRVADVACSGPLPRLSRARVAAEAVMGVLGQSAELSEGDEELIDKLLQSARQAAPQLPEVHGASAAAAERRGSLSEAVKGWLAAADHAKDPADAGEYRRRAGELQLGLEGPRAAEPILQRALVELGSDDPQLIARLAVVAAELGDETRASELFAKLLRKPPQDAAHQDALVTAARHHVEGGAPDRARPFLAALGPFLQPNEPASEHEHALDGESLEIQLPLEEPNPESGESGPQQSPLIQARPMSPAQQVTLVEVADDEVRALLEEAQSVEDPGALLDGALERALEDADAAGIRRVLRVIDRVAPFPGESALRERALRLLDRIGDDE